jgi:hypothetical protein
MYTRVAYRVGERLRALGNGKLRHGRIHSVFSRAANIEIDGSLYVLFTGDGASGRSVNVMGADLQASYLRAGQPCRLTSEGFEAGSLYVDLRRAETWRPRLRPGWRSVPCPSTVRYFLDTLGQHYPNAGRHASVDVGAVRRLGCLATAFKAARRLIGLGPGLTPAGDDITLGAIAAANHLLLDSALADVLSLVVIERGGKTTDLSLQMLSDAVNGEYHEFVDRLVSALATDDIEGVDEGLRRLSGVGASSGCDMVAGVAAVMRAQHNSCLIDLPDQMPSGSLRIV